MTWYCTVLNWRHANVLLFFYFLSYALSIVQNFSFCRVSSLNLKITVFVLLFLQFLLKLSKNPKTFPLTKETLSSWNVRHLGSLYLRSRGIWTAAPCQLTVHWWRSSKPENQNMKVYIAVRLRILLGLLQPVLLLPWEVSIMATFSVHCRFKWLKI